jgi:hypothetical protein
MYTYGTTYFLCLAQIFYALRHLIHISCVAILMENKMSGGVSTNKSKCKLYYIGVLESLNV